MMNFLLGTYVCEKGGVEMDEWKPRLNSVLGVLKLPVHETNWNYTFSWAWLLQDPLSATIVVR